MKRAGRDEEDVIGLHRAVLRGDGRAFDQRQQVALHTFARDVGTASFRPGAKLVDFVEENDTGVLDVGDGVARDAFVIDQLFSFFDLEWLPGVAHQQCAPLGLVAAAEDAAEIDGADRSVGHVRQFEHWRGRRRRGHVEFDILLVEFARAQLSAKRVPRGG